MPVAPPIAVALGQGRSPALGLPVASQSAMAVERLRSPAPGLPVALLAAEAVGQEQEQVVRLALVGQAPQEPLPDVLVVPQLQLAQAVKAHLVVVYWPPIVGQAVRQ